MWQFSHIFYLNNALKIDNNLIFVAGWLIWILKTVFLWYDTSGSGEWSQSSPQISPDCQSQSPLNCHQGHQWQ